jgi:hypothetical protein
MCRIAFSLWGTILPTHGSSVAVLYPARAIPTQLERFGAAINSWAEIMINSWAEMEASAVFFTSSSVLGT